MELQQILSFAVKHGISDVHLKVDKPPYFRKDGVLLTQKGAPAVKAETMAKWFAALSDERAARAYERDKEADFAYANGDGGRFRISAFCERGNLAMALRYIPKDVPTIKSLGLPPVLEEVAGATRGLVLVTGVTGAGKSTTLAALIEAMNVKRSCHVITIEDPIEYVFEDKRAIISQREVGSDTGSFAGALRAALRQDPDVILLGELRDMETTETAIQAAETGHLVLSTMHTTDASETIHRMVALFPAHQHELLRLQLSSVLRGIISQRLVRSVEGRLVAACEIMRQTELIKGLIVDPSRTSEIRMAIADGRTAYGMQTFDQALVELHGGGQISQEEALAHATNPADMRLTFDGIGASPVRRSG